MSDQKMQNKQERFFTLLADTAVSAEDGKGIIISGMLHGALKKGDEMFIYHPAGKVLKATAETIFTENKETIDVAMNCEVSVKVPEISDPKEVPHLTAICSVRPQTSGDVLSTLQNPQLVTFIRDIHKFQGQSDFMNILFFLTCHGRFIVPTVIDGPEPEAKDGKIVLPPGSKMSFPMLKNKDDTVILPIFTDMAEFSKWKALFEKKPPRTVVISFKEAVKISAGNGIAINPFGDSSLSLPKELIDNIVSSEGFKREFEAGTATNTNGFNLRVRPVRANEETRLIKEAMIDYANDKENISRIDLLERYISENESGYLCVVDCPATDKEEIYKGLRLSLKGIIADDVKMDFMLYAGNEIIDKVGKANTVVYVK